MEKRRRGRRSWMIVLIIVGKFLLKYIFYGSIINGGTD